MSTARRARAVSPLSSPPAYTYLFLLVQLISSHCTISYDAHFVHALSLLYWRYRRARRCWIRGFFQSLSLFYGPVCNIGSVSRPRLLQMLLIYTRVRPRLYPARIQEGPGPYVRDHMQSKSLWARPSAIPPPVRDLVNRCAITDAPLWDSGLSLVFCRITSRTRIHPYSKRTCLRLHPVAMHNISRPRNRRLRPAHGFGGVDGG